MKSIREKFNDLESQITNLNFHPNDSSRFKSLIEFYGSTNKEENISSISQLIMRGLNPEQEKCCRVFRVFSILDKQIDIRYLETLIADLQSLGKSLVEFKNDLNQTIAREKDLKNLYFLGEVCLNNKLENELRNVNNKISIYINSEIVKVHDKDYHLNLAYEYIKSNLSSLANTEELLRLIISTNKIKDISSINPNLVNNLKSVLTKKNFSGKPNINFVLAAEIKIVYNFVRKPPQVYGDESAFNELIFSSLNEEEFKSIEAEFNELKSFKGPDSPFLPISSLDLNRTDSQIIVKTQAFVKPLTLELSDRLESFDYFTQQDFDSMLSLISNLQKNLKSSHNFISIDANNIVMSGSDKLLCFRLDRVTESQMDDLSIIRHQLLNLIDNYP